MQKATAAGLWTAERAGLECGLTPRQILEASRSDGPDRLPRYEFNPKTIKFKPSDVLEFMETHRR